MSCQSRRGRSRSADFPDRRCLVSGGWSEKSLLDEMTQHALVLPSPPYGVSCRASLDEIFPPTVASKPTSRFGARTFGCLFWSEAYLVQHRALCWQPVPEACTCAVGMVQAHSHSCGFKARAAPQVACQSNECTWRHRTRKTALPPSENEGTGSAPFLWLPALPHSFLLLIPCFHFGTLKPLFQSSCLSILYPLHASDVSPPGWQH